MKNEIFNVTFSKETGGIDGLFLSVEEDGINFCKAGGSFFTVKKYTKRREVIGYTLQSHEENETDATSVYERYGVLVTVKYTLQKDGLFVNILVDNTNDFPVYHKQADFSLTMPFNDAYESSEICIPKRCNTHFWAGLDTTYIRAVRMGNIDRNVGVVFDKGRFASYSQEGCPNSNNRGYFLLDNAPFMLLPKQQYEISCRVFLYATEEEFVSECKKSPNYLHIESVNGYTFFQKDKKIFTVTAPAPIQKATCVCSNGKAVTKVYGNTLSVQLKPKTLGHNRVEIEVDGVKTYANFCIYKSVEDHIQKRVKFIVEKQQCLEKDSPLYGAYLCYDNEEDRQFYDHRWRDQNASRERVGMGLLVAKYLQTHKDKKVEQSLLLYRQFVAREFLDENTGMVCDSIGMDNSIRRLYNILWVANLYEELYNLFKEREYLEIMVRIIQYYYGLGGAKFYPNAISMYKCVKALAKAGMNQEREEVLRLFEEHIDCIVERDVYYPPHEVNFEQTIATPATNLLLDRLAISGEEKYRKEAEKHLNILHRFDGTQPDYRLNKIPIRFWDAYWFGRSEMHGDTRPHYWSALSGYCFWFYGEIIGSEVAREYGRQCLKNCLCVTDDEGRGYCAYLYPYHINGERGEYNDMMANDQDYALYYALLAL